MFSCSESLVRPSLGGMFNSDSVFVEPAWSERDVVDTTSLQCMYGIMGFDQTRTSVFMDEVKNNLAQLFSLTLFSIFIYSF